MEYLKRVLVLKDANNKGFLVFERIQSTVSAHLTVIKGDFKEPKLVISIGNNILSPVHVKFNNEKSFKFLISENLDLNSSICAGVVSEGRVVLYGTTSGEDRKNQFMAKLEHKAEVKLEPKVEPKLELKIEPRLEIRQEQKTEPVVLPHIKEMCEEPVIKETNMNELRQEFPKFEEAVPVSSLVEDANADVNPEIIEEILESRAKEIDIVEDEILKTKPAYEKKEVSYFGLVQSQIDDMFKTYPEEKELKERIPNSKWVHVDYSEGLYYALGVIYEKEEPAKICYAVPSRHGYIPPISSEGFAKWIEAKHKDKYGVDFDGYYVLEQNAKNGEVE